MERPQPRPFHVRPAPQRDFDEVVAGETAREQPPDQLHVEGPASVERLFESAGQHRRGAERLGATLGVVDRQPEDERGEGGEEPPQVVPRGLPLDLGAEQRHPRTHRHLGAAALQQAQDADHLLAGGGEICVEVGDEIAAGLERFQQALTHRFGLAHVPIEHQEPSPARHRAADALQQEGRAVGGPVIDQEQADSRQVPERQDALGRQPMGLVEARNDDGRVAQRKYLESAL